MAACIALGDGLMRGTLGPLSIWGGGREISRVPAVRRTAR